MSDANSLQAINRLWQEHSAAPYPKGLAGKLIASVDVTTLDTYVAGCVSTFLSREGNLDLWRTAILGLCYRELGQALPGLQGEGRTYFMRLDALARMVLEAVRDCNSG
jgi:hypothetical protein